MKKCGCPYLRNLSVDNLAAFYRSQGFQVALEVYVRNPLYKIGRRYDLVVKDANGDFVGFEYKGTANAVAKYSGSRQAKADGWVQQQGGTMFGSAAESAGFEGSVTKVILLGPTSPPPKL